MVVLGGALWLTKQRADRAADESIERALDATRSAIDDALAGRSSALRQSVRVIAQIPDYIARISEGLRQSERANLLDQADEFRDQVEAAWALLTDGEGVLRAKTNERDLDGEPLAEGALVGIPLEGRVAEGVWIEPGSDGSDVIYQAVGAPIMAPQSSVVYGVLVAAVPVDSAFAAHLKSNTNSEMVFFAFDTLGVPHPVVATLPAEALQQAMAAGVGWDSAMADPTRGRLRWTVGGQTLVGVVGTLNTASGVPVGAYAGLRSRDLELATFIQLRNTVFQAFIAGLVLAIFSAWVLARRVTRPVQRLVAATRQVAEGQYSGKIQVTSRDEIGELAAAFQRMLRELKEKQDLVEYLSGSGAQTVALTAGQQVQVTAQGQGTRPAAMLTGVLEAGQVLANRYEIRKVLGAGGMGMVYRAFDRQLEEIVAVKTLKPEAISEDGKSLERFKEEIRLARRITHRNVVRTHDLGEVDGVYYITMELVEGTNLKDLIRKRGRLPVGVALTVGKQLCRALEVAHDAGVIHRDIKPQNMVVDPGGFLKVMDFGIARRTEGHRMGGEGLTAVGTAIGTPEYMAPEQLLGEDLDPRVDLYAAGAVLFECVTGRNVFTAPNVMALMAKHLEEAPEDPQFINPEVPPSLAQVILRALSKKRDQRWGSAADMHRALEDVRTEETVVT
ncbi:MAG TPA: protein kinase [Gemmatimonadales bacterium]|nr:protein kinase [Gemmatimonadales bacterium]